MCYNFGSGERPLGSLREKVRYIFNTVQFEDRSQRDGLGTGLRQGMFMRGKKKAQIKTDMCNTRSLPPIANIPASSVPPVHADTLRRVGCCPRCCNLHSLPQCLRLLCPDSKGVSSNNSMGSLQHGQIASVCPTQMQDLGPSGSKDEDKYALSIGRPASQSSQQVAS